MLLGRLLAQQPDSCIREIKLSTLGVGSVCMCVCVPGPSPDCPDGPLVEDVGATTCPAQAIVPEKAEAEFSAAAAALGLETDSVGSTSEEIPVVPIWLCSFETPRCTCLLKLQL